MAQIPEGIGTGELPGGAVACRGNTWDVTSEVADKAGAGGRHGAKQGKKKRVAGQWKTPSSKSSGVGSREGGGRGLCWGGKLQGVFPGSGRVSRVAKGHRHPWSGRVAPGEETSGVTPKGDGVPGEDGRRRGGDGDSPTTHSSKASRYSCRDEEMTSGMGPVTPPIPQRGTSAGRGSEVIPHMHPDSADGGMPKCASKYGLLAPAEPEGDPFVVEL